MARAHFRSAARRHHTTPDVTFVTLAGDFNQLSNGTILLLGLVAEFNEPPCAVWMDYII